MLHQPLETIHVEQCGVCRHSSDEFYVMLLAEFVEVPGEVFERIPCAQGFPTEKFDLKPIKSVCEPFLNEPDNSFGDV
jgi:hypothetical protein